MKVVEESITEKEETVLRRDESDEDAVARIVILQDQSEYQIYRSRVRDRYVPDPDIADCPTC